MSQLKDTRWTPSPLPARPERAGESAYPPGAPPALQDGAYLTCRTLAEMSDRDYSHRDVLDKLGLHDGLAVAIDERGGPLDPAVAARISAEPPSTPLDLVLITMADGTDILDALTTWRKRLRPDGGIWVLTPKRGLPGYLDQRVVISFGPATELVDNKVCSISARTSAMRFVIPRSLRSYLPPDPVQIQEAL